MINTLRQIYLLRPIVVEELVKGEATVTTTQLTLYHFGSNDDPPCIQGNMANG